MVSTSLTAQQEDKKKITRSTVNRAIRALCGYNWLEQVGNGKIRLNVRLWFQGSSTAQHEVLAGIAAEHDYDVEGFPYQVGPERPGQQELDLRLGNEEPYGRQERTG